MLSQISGTTRPTSPERPRSSFTGLLLLAKQTLQLCLVNMIVFSMGQHEYQQQQHCTYTCTLYFPDYYLLQ
ncbi:hypothetical protein I79_022391 [Cricetulus griseus]|uniref:Uncharacterized protein n=1 Tax=Cricetulus griseus TaxID=10029 RepID=G3IF75_CRIGR|nr:hypothetical protein I79_022391 [Cricetulus griseus]